MSDIISRQAAIDAMTNTLWHYPNECYRNLNEYEFAKGLAELGLKSVPSAQPEQRWIPCSERLPKPESKEQRRGFYLTTNGYGSVGVTRYEFYNDFQKTGWQNDIRIDAWMSLPEPYKDVQ